MNLNQARRTGRKRKKHPRGGLSNKSLLGHTVYKFWSHYISAFSLGWGRLLSYNHNTAGGKRGRIYDIGSTFKAFALKLKNLNFKILSPTEIWGMLHLLTDWQSAQQWKKVCCHPQNWKYNTLYCHYVRYTWLSTAYMGVYCVQMCLLCATVCIL